MQIYAREFMRYMDEKGVKYTEREENVIKVVYSGDNMDSIPVFVIFDEDNDPLVQLKCWDVQNFKNNEASALMVCNSLNYKYRWVKFYLDKDSDIVVSIDAMIDQDTCGEECLSLVRRLVNITDEAFPEIARARWAQ
ncbi:MAG: YbjN domain-containing protein [Clostridia bacterium]|jgi:hypothetical protein|nr:YbjN domain-containing protein [Clostridia bacterium]MBQ5793722.1 YbjN domain-containing protein [Clostridia bacterium]